MAVATIERPSVTVILAAEEQAAWTEYLDDTRNRENVRYEELEPWAWNRLGVKLGAIQARRRAAEEAA